MPDKIVNIEELQKENAELKTQLAEYEAAAVQAVADEKEIRDRMIAGLSREQAIQVITDQRAHDERLAKAKEAAPAPAAKGKK